MNRTTDLRHHSIVPVAAIVALAMAAFPGGTSVATAHELTFEVHAAAIGLNGAMECALADLDLDGDMDLGAVGYDGDQAIWLENDGAQNWTTHVLGTPDGPRSIVMVGPDGQTLDLDQDGDGDVLVTAFMGDQLLWYENDGAMSFTEHVVDADFDGAHTLVPGDLDQDGDLDLAATGYDLAWFENDGAMAFTRHDLPDPDDMGCCIQAIDLDQDGDLDLFVTVQGTGANLLWYENNGTGQFSQHVVSAAYNNAHTGFAGDLDQDGDLDLATCSWSPSDYSWWENDGAQGFTRHVLGSTAFYNFWIEPTDLDQDGDVDLLGASNIGGITWFDNDGAMNFTQRNVDEIFSNAFCARAGDIDGDGDLDVVACARSRNRVNWCENLTMVGVADGPGQGEGPATVPRGLTVSAAPNPFNPRTTITYTLDRAAAVTLEVWDVAGRRVACLDHGPRSAGRHAVAWEPRDLPSGTYTCRLVTAAQVVARKLTLLK